MVWVGKDLTDHLVPTALRSAGTPSTIPPCRPPGLYPMVLHQTDQCFKGPELSFLISTREHTLIMQEYKATQSRGYANAS